mmetsp:Transcript_18526/g.54164  ORF Transcript_18526/g.54164 Transcript_18526/m.54164 type:complete len:211 (-) Transcript_18526:1711-2343(-)
MRRGRSLRGGVGAGRAPRRGAHRGARRLPQVQGDAARGGGARDARRDRPRPGRPRPRRGPGPLARAPGAARGPARDGAVPPRLHADRAPHRARLRGDPAQRLPRLPLRLPHLQPRRALRVRAELRGRGLLHLPLRPLADPRGGARGRRDLRLRRGGAAVGAGLVPQLRGALPRPRLAAGPPRRLRGAPHGDQHHLLRVEHGVHRRGGGGL